MKNLLRIPICVFVRRTSPGVLTAFSRENTRITDVYIPFLGCLLLIKFSTVVSCVWMLYSSSSSTLCIWLCINTKSSLKNIIKKNQCLRPTAALSTVGPCGTWCCPQSTDEDPRTDPCNYPKISQDISPRKCRREGDPTRDHVISIDVLYMHACIANAISD